MTNCNWLQLLISLKMVKTQSPQASLSRLISWWNKLSFHWLLIINYWSTGAQWTLIGPHWTPLDDRPTQHELTNIANVWGNISGSAGRSTTRLSSISPKVVRGRFAHVGGGVSMRSNGVQWGLPQRDPDYTSPKYLTAACAQQCSLHPFPFNSESWWCERTPIQFSILGRSSYMLFDFANGKKGTSCEDIWS